MSNPLSQPKFFANVFAFNLTFYSKQRWDASACSSAQHRPIRNTTSLAPPDQPPLISQKTYFPLIDSFFAQLGAIYCSSHQNIILTGIDMREIYNKCYKLYIKKLQTEKQLEYLLGIFEQEFFVERNVKNWQISN